MNIQEAGQQIEQAIAAYLLRNEAGKLRTTVQQQRPPFLYGPPGIGKTEIVQQIAKKLNIGFVDYSMTHHTRQSALGLPIIATRTYSGIERKVSDYTMSEILSSVYDQVEAGQTQGILFLDEVNCVSETLAPAMMKFLQYKTFGKDAVPEGWVVVTAGNPPEYNNSAKEYDAVTWDRLKRLDVEPNYESWRAYSVATSVHGAVVTYLDTNPRDFYKDVTAVDGRRFITARAWSDLSKMIQIYEDLNYKVDLCLVAQYIQEQEVAKKFETYYKNYNNLRVRIDTAAILEGTVSEKTMEFLSTSKDKVINAIWMHLAEVITKKANDTFAELEVQKELLAHYKALRGLSLEQQNTYLQQAQSASANSARKEAALLLKDSLNTNYLEVAKEIYQKNKVSLDKRSKEVVSNVDHVYVLAKALDTEERKSILMWTQCLASRTHVITLMLQGKSKHIKTWGKQLQVKSVQKDLLEELNKLEKEEV